MDLWHILTGSALVISELLAFRDKGSNGLLHFAFNICGRLYKVDLEIKSEIQAESIE